jgi:hypothetical protein
MGMIGSKFKDVNPKLSRPKAELKGRNAVTFKPGKNLIKKYKLRIFIISFRANPFGKLCPFSFFYMYLGS